eukprot:10564965-Karenia_brevis.AAC.1
MPGACRFFIDCEPCVAAVHRGWRWATSAKRKHARVFGMIFPVIDDTPPEAFIWMPSHTKESDVGRRLRGDGRHLSHKDRHGNMEADRHAKLA